MWFATAIFYGLGKGLLALPFTITAVVVAKFGCTKTAEKVMAYYWSI
jgi:hypothetical protein